MRGEEETYVWTKTIEKVKTADEGPACRRLLGVLVLLLEEVVAGDGQGGHQHHELVKVHLVVFVGVQVVHDFLHQHRILLGLKEGQRKPQIHSFRCLLVKDC